jgi:hypothetical protein
MNTRTQVYRGLGFALLWFGILLAMALASVGTLADLEAAFYGFPWWAEESLPGFRCPILMTRSETGTISVTLKNPTDRTIPFLAHADISTTGPTREVRTKVEVAPGEKKRVDWTVTSADVDLGFFIFANGWTNPAYPYPYRQSMCGILVLDVPGLTGQQIFALTLLVSLSSMVGGMCLWIAGNRPLKGRRRSAAAGMALLALVVLVALLASILGAWMAGIVLLALAVLMITVLLFYILTD